MRLKRWDESSSVICTGLEATASHVRCNSGKVLVLRGVWERALGDWALGDMMSAQNAVVVLAFISLSTSV